MCLNHVQSCLGIPALLLLAVRWQRPCPSSNSKSEPQWPSLALIRLRLTDSYWTSPCRLDSRGIRISLQTVFSFRTKAGPVILYSFSGM